MMARRTVGETIADTTTTPTSWDDDEGDVSEQLANGEGNGAADIPAPDAKQKVSKYARFVATEQVTAAATEVSHTCAYGPPPKTAFVLTCSPESGSRG
jgi:hypothetical protein